MKMWKYRWKMCTVSILICDKLYLVFWSLKKELKETTLMAQPPPPSNIALMPTFLTSLLIFHLLVKQVDACLCLLTGEWGFAARSNEGALSREKGRGHRVYRVPGFPSSRPNWVAHSPHTQKCVGPPHSWVQGGRHTRLRGGTQFRRWDRHSGTLGKLQSLN